MTEKPEIPWRKVTALSGMLTGVYAGHIEPKPMPGVKFQPGYFIEAAEAAKVWTTLAHQAQEIHRRTVLEERMVSDVKILQKVIESWAKAADHFMGWLDAWKGAFHSGGRFVHPDEARRAFLGGLAAEGIGIDECNRDELI